MQLQCKLNKFLSTKIEVYTYDIAIGKGRRGVGVVKIPP